MIKWVSSKLNTLMVQKILNKKIKRQGIIWKIFSYHTTLMVVSEELKSLLMKVKEENEKVGLTTF